MILPLIGTLLVVAGYQLRFKKRYSLIAGYDAKRTSNPEPIARLLGGVTLVGGLCFVIAGVGSRLFPAKSSWDAVTAVLAVGMVAAILFGSVGLKRRA